MGLYDTESVSTSICIDSFACDVNMRENWEPTNGWNLAPDGQRG